MIDLYKNIKKRREELEMTQGQLAEKAGYADKSMIAKIEKGQVDLAQSKIEVIAHALLTTPRALMGWDDIPSYPNIHPVATRRLPMLGSVACGEPVFMSEDYEFQVDATEDIKADFCLRAKGDSMKNINVNDGDLIFVRKQDTVENGEIAVVAIDDEATLKRFYRYADMIVLRAENPAYKDMVYTAADHKKIRILGKAVRHMNNLY